MAQTKVSVPAVATAIGGTVLIWVGVKGLGLVSGVRALLSANPASAGVGSQLGAAAASAVPGTGAIIGQTAGGLAGDSAIASAALAYNGAGIYRWGSATPAGWDCSGFVNYVIGHDLGLAIPGVRSGFTGKWHGPVTAQWAVTPLCINITRAEVQAGDLVVWPARHMGIAVSNSEMINCPGPNGTVAPTVDAIDGHRSLGPVVYRRYRG